MQCTDTQVIYSVKSSGCMRPTPENCRILTAMPNDEHCHVQCDCIEGRCLIQALVREVANYDQWALCPIQVT